MKFSRWKVKSVHWKNLFKIREFFHKNNRAFCTWRTSGCLKIMWQLNRQLVHVIVLFTRIVNSRSVDCVQIMATAIDVLQPFIDTLTCPVCYLVLDKPRLLPCGHTFCLSCIQELYVQTRSDGDSDYSDDDDYENVAAFPVSLLSYCKLPWKSSFTTVASPISFCFSRVL